MALLGDTHAATSWTVDVIEQLGEDGIRCIVQLGDFGWWPDVRQRFVKQVGDAAKHQGILFAFIDGNHEHHGNLRNAANKNDADAFSKAEPVLMPEGVWYLPRGCAWEWSGVKFRAMGGAFSIDHKSRIPGITVFRSETPSRAEMEQAAAAGPADVLLCHDYPALGHEVPSTWDGEAPPEDEEASRKVREALAWLCSKINPRLVVHGHWHYRYSVEQGGITVEGLSRDQSDEAVILLDLETLETEDWGRKRSEFYWGVSGTRTIRQSAPS